MDAALTILKGTAIGSGKTIFQLLIVIIPMLVLIELLREAKLMDKITSKLSIFAKALGIPNEAMLSVAVGVLGGLSYGAGASQELTRGLELTRGQVNTMFIFVGLCHGAIEESFIYWSVGANPGVIFLSRLIMGVAAVAIYRTYLAIRDKKMAP